MEIPIERLNQIDQIKAGDEFLIDPAVSTVYAGITVLDTHARKCKAIGNYTQTKDIRKGVVCLEKHADYEIDESAMPNSVVLRRNKGNIEKILAGEKAMNLARQYLFLLRPCGK